MRYNLTQRTSYRYASAVDLAWHVLHLRPRQLPFQKVANSEIVSSPRSAETDEGLDHFGNNIGRLMLNETHDHFTVEMRAEVGVAFPAAPDPLSTAAWEQVAQDLDGDGFPNPVEANEFVHNSPLVAAHPGLLDYARPSFNAGRPVLDAVIDLTHRIKRDFAYDPGATDISTPLLQVLNKRRGVCQDFAQLQIGCLRSLGLAARYVSGYIRTRPRPGQAALRGADASHAWVSVWCGAAGWIDVDPTNDLVVADQHVLVGWGRDFSDVSPVRGVILGGGAQAFAVSVELMPVDQAPT
jgi:transglutaminase-like putative cysteine protease